MVVRDDNGTPGNTADDFHPTFQSGDTNSNGRLDTTETWTYQATRTVTAGQYTNIGSVTANPVDATGADIVGLAGCDRHRSEQSPGDHDGRQHRQIHQRRRTPTRRPDRSLRSEAPPRSRTSSRTRARWRWARSSSVDNNGHQANTADDFSPTLQSGDTNSNGRLDTTETWTYQATRTVTAGQYTNIGSVTANPVDANGADIANAADVTDTDPSNHFGFTAGIGLQKLTNGIDTGTGTGPSLGIGSTATFTYNVTNTGNIALTNIVDHRQ